MSARNLAAALKNLDIKYIIIESVLIINGILVAVTINSWNEDRQNRDKAENYISYLKRDLEGERQMVDSFVKFEEAVKNEASEAMNSIASNQNIYEDDSLQRKIISILPRMTLSLPTPTYEDLLNTGNLSLIKKVQVRDAIIHYYQNLKSMVSIIENNNSRVIDQQISKQFYDTNLLDFDLSYSAEKYLPAMLGVKDMREVFTNLRTTSPEENPSLNLEQKRQLANMIKLRLLVSVVAIEYGRRIIAESESLIDLIDSAYLD